MKKMKKKMMKQWLRREKTKDLGCYELTAMIFKTKTAHLLKHVEATACYIHNVRTLLLLLLLQYVRTEQGMNERTNERTNNRYGFYYFFQLGIDDDQLLARGIPQAMLVLFYFEVYRILVCVGRERMKLAPPS